MATVDVRITSIYPPNQESGIRGYASATIDGCLGIRGIKIVEGGKNGLFVSMPSRKGVDGYKDICFPVTAEFGNQLRVAVLDAYHQALNQAVSQSGSQAQAEPVSGGPQMQM
ncbi:SpoVG family protein [Enterocloster bolteae]|uniref:SpoVG family protein n=1 Tax=Clostridia TaxID=186801 RepID=UPI000CCF8F9B|nr:MULTISPECIES: SpoVG family protein [Clostridia]MBS6219508.1 SpoVG family protein [[Clostridium] symbiosum]MCB6928311.1 SpoVG family protein [Enterocloster bolteae]PNV63091.1 SpoVG family protein [Clostridium sp. chh4-2]